MEQHEFAAGTGQVIVVYDVADISVEIIPSAVFAEIAADAAARAERGQWVISMAVMPTRHGGTAWGDEGSGFQTKASVVVVYGETKGG